MRILMTGGTGFIGNHLAARLLQEGHEVVVTSRWGQSPLSGRSRYRMLVCDTTEKGPWQKEVPGCDAIVNLAGRSIFTRWNETKKKEMETSRLKTTSHLVEAVEEGGPSLFLSASAVGYYGHRDEALLGEEETVGQGFLASLCQRWEDLALGAEEKGVRVVLLRFGAVLGKNGGALATMLPAYRFCLGGALGDGRQWFPWVHIEDLVGAALFAMENEEAKGPFNITAPFLARQSEFSRTLAKVLGRPAPFWVPSLALKLIFGELGRELLFSQRVAPQKLSNLGFQFSHPSLEPALSDLLGK